MATPKAQKTGRPHEGFLTRIEASDLLRCSIATLLNWERKGFLHPVVGLHGVSTREVYLYDPRELANLPNRRLPPMAPGEIESRAFDMFERGMSIRRVVIMLRITSEEAWALRERWLDADSALDPTTKREIEISADAHADRSDAEIEHAIERALDASDARK